MGTFENLSTQGSLNTSSHSAVRMIDGKREVPAEQRNISEICGKFERIAERIDSNGDALSCMAFIAMMLVSTISFCRAREKRFLFWLETYALVW